MARHLTAICALVLTCVHSVHGQSSLRYFYDDNSQLFRALDGAGTLLEYVYDPVGNILEVRRSTVSPGALSILNITPLYAKPGATVRIYGQNFSAVLAGNVVKFNGIQATILSASPTEIVVVVPPGDTTGAATVTVGNQTVSSGSVQFRGVRIPVITKVTPATGLEPGAPFFLVVEGSDLDEATLGTFPEGGFSLPAAANGLGNPVAAQAYAGLPGLYAVTATNLAGTSSTIVSAANQLRVIEPAGPKEAVGKMVSLQNGTAETLGYPVGRRESVSKALSLQNGSVETLGYSAGRREANAAVTSIQNGAVELSGFGPGSREAFAAVTSLRNGATALSPVNGSGIRGGLREISLLAAKDADVTENFVGGGETVTFRAAGLTETKLALGGEVIREDPDNVGAWTVTIPPDLRELALRLEGLTAEGAPVNREILLRVQPESQRQLQARVAAESGELLAETTVTVEPSGWDAAFYDVRTGGGPLPVLDGLRPSFRRNLSALHLRNPNGAFGQDPWGTQITPDLIVRATTRLRVETAGLHRFLLRAPVGARIRIGGDTATVSDGALSAAMEVNLTPGDVPLEVVWAEGEKSAEVELFLAPPAGKLQTIAPGLLACEPAMTMRTSAEGALVLPALSSAVGVLRISLAGDSAENAWIVPVLEQNLGTLTLRRAAASK